jgi:hypothetical protein
MTAFNDFLWSALPILGYVLGFLLVIVGGLIASVGARQGLRDRATTGGNIFAIGVLFVLAAALVPLLAEPLGQAAISIIAAVTDLFGGDSFFGGLGAAVLIFLIGIAIIGILWGIVRLLGIAVTALFMSLYPDARQA